MLDCASGIMCFLLFVIFCYFLFLQENQVSLVNTLEQTKEMYENNLLERDIKLKDISNSKEQLVLQIKEIQLTADSLQSSLKSEKQR